MCGSCARLACAGARCAWPAAVLGRTATATAAVLGTRTVGTVACRCAVALRDHRALLHATRAHLVPVPWQPAKQLYARAVLGRTERREAGRTERRGPVAWDRSAGCQGIQATQGTRAVTLGHGCNGVRFAVLSVVRRCCGGCGGAYTHAARCEQVTDVPSCSPVVCSPLGYDVAVSAVLPVAPSSYTRLSEAQQYAISTGAGTGTGTAAAPAATGGGAATGAGNDGRGGRGGGAAASDSNPIVFLNPDGSASLSVHAPTAPGASGTSGKFDGKGKAAAFAGASGPASSGAMGMGMGTGATASAAGARIVVACPRCRLRLTPPRGAPVFACPCGQHMRTPHAVTAGTWQPHPPTSPPTYQPAATLPARHPPLEVSRCSALPAVCRRACPLVTLCSAATGPSPCPCAAAALGAMPFMPDRSTW